MGAYLSAPRTEKDSIDEKNERLACGASSMQGWRINQEDAHNCELNFDDDASFFAVYDGHGGPEIALYCSKYLPAFLKATESYTRGEFEQALRDAFLGFDAKLLLGDVIDELKVLAGDKYSYGDEDGDGSDSDEDLAQLKQEGGMPIEAVLSRYREMMKKNNSVERLKEGEVGGAGGSGSSSTAFKPHSPCLRAKKQPVISTSNGGGGSSEQKPSESCEEAVSSSSSEKDAASATVEETPSASSSTAAPSLNDQAAPSGVEEATVAESSTTSKDVETPDSSSIEGKVGNSEGAAGSSSSSAAETTTTTANDVSSSSSTKATDSAAPSASSSSTDLGLSVGCSSSSSSAAAAAATPVDGVNGESSSSSAVATAGSISSTNMDRAAKRVARVINQADGDESESDEEEKDMTYSENNSTSSDLNSDSDEENLGEDDDDEDDEEEEEEEDYEEMGEEDTFISNMVEEPGKDSGCTAVVALLKGRDLYVANAGDSRCVLSRGGKVVEMSFDHKPEDREEHTRISKAGGRVTADGRVNGGLNLSRAIGDHAYKMNSKLPAEEQMISAKPDIQMTTLTDEDEFMVLACDGIWNFMSSKAVVNFVKDRLDKGETQLSRICEELFDHCLAKDTSGDGTGCDNMTAIVVRFKWSQNSITNEAEVVAEVGVKRAASTEGSGTGDCDMKAKRAKTEAEANAPSTTST